MRLLLILFTSILCAQPVITPGTAQIVKQGATLQFNADVAVTWSLGTGSLGSIDSDGLYHAPASVTPPQVMRGCQLGWKNHIYNTRIDSLPVDTWSADIVRPDLGNNAISYTGPFPTDAITDSTYPLQTITWYRGGVPSIHMPVFGLNINQNGTFRVENGWYAWDIIQNDRHTVTVNKNTCLVEETYGPYPIGLYTPDMWGGSGGGAYNSMALPATAGIDAAGMPGGPLMIHPEEIANGAINHMIRFTLQSNAGCGYWPSQRSLCDHSMTPGGTPLGAIFRLPTVKYNAIYAGASAIAKILLDQMHKYGLIMNDVGYSGQATIETDPRLTITPAFSNAAAEVAGSVGLQDFEIVDVSGLKIANNSYETNAVAELVTATANVGGLTSTVRVMLRAVTMDVDQIYQTFVAGAPATQLNAWVTGATDTSITWSMSPTVGSLNASTGIYTAPSSVGSITTTTVTATSVADGTVSKTIKLIILPNSGKIRIDACGSSDHTDVNGDVWYGDQMLSRGIIGSIGSSWISIPILGAGIAWVGIPAADRTLYNSFCFPQEDILYRFNVPNGTWNLHLLYGAWDNGSNRPHIGIDSQGVVKYTMSDPYLVAGSNLYGIADYNLTSTVSDGTLYFSVRHRGGAVAGTFPDGSSFYTDGGSAGLSAFTMEQIIPPVPLVEYKGKFIGVKIK